MQPNDPSKSDKNYNSIESAAVGEQKLYEVRKHPFGIIMLYVEALFGLAIVLGGMFFLVPQLLGGNNTGQYNGIMALVAVVATVITLIVLFLASVVYHQSYLIMTDKNVTQVLQQGLFRRKVSELALSNIEDVTAEQRGLIQTLFNFGTLNVETAGEVENFSFPYCPKPNYCGKMLLDARQHYIEADPSRSMLANNRLNLPPNPQPMYQQPYPQAPQPEQTPAQPAAPEQTPQDQPPQQV